MLSSEIQTNCVNSGAFSTVELETAPLCFSNFVGIFHRGIEVDSAQFVSITSVRQSLFQRLNSLIKTSLALQKIKKLQEAIRGQFGTKELCQYLAMIGKLS